MHAEELVSCHAFEQSRIDKRLLACCRFERIVGANGRGQTPSSKTGRSYFVTRYWISDGAADDERRWVCASFGKCIRWVLVNRASTGWTNTGNLNGWEMSAEGKSLPCRISCDMSTQYGVAADLLRAHVWRDKSVNQRRGLRVSCSDRGFQLRWEGSGRLHTHWSDSDTSMWMRLIMLTVKRALPTRLAEDSITAAFEAGCGYKATVADPLLRKVRTIPGSRLGW